MKLSFSVFLYGVIFFFIMLLVSQVFFRNGVKEGLLANTLTATNYTMDDAFEDISDHDKRLSALEAQSQGNNNNITDLQAKASKIEGFMPSQQKSTYTREHEDMDLNNQRGRISALQESVKKAIGNIGELNVKLKLTPLNQYTAADTNMTIASYTDNQSEIVAHEKAISQLEQVIKENTDDITEINDQIQKISDQHKEVVNKVTAGGPPKISGLK